MPSNNKKSSSKSSAKRENPRAAKTAPTSRAPRTREAALAASANTFALAKTGKSFGAPVTEPQVRYYERACKALRKTKTLAQFLGFKSAESALRALRPVAQGTASSSALPSATKDSFDKLYQRLTALHSADGKVNKTWPRKHAIVLVALLSEKPVRKPTAKPKPKTTEPTVAPDAPSAS